MEYDYINKRFKLPNGEFITFLRWVDDVKGKQYFIASDNAGNEITYHVVVRDENNRIAQIQKVR